MFSIEEANRLLKEGDGVLSVSLDYSMYSQIESDNLFERLSKSIMFIVVHSGSADVEIDYKLRHIDSKTNNLVVIGVLSKIGSCSMEQDFKADLLIIAKKFVVEVLPSMKSLANSSAMYVPVNNIVAMRDKPLHHLKQTEKKLCHDLLKQVSNNANRMDHMLRVQLLYLKVIEFSLELSNMLFSKYKGISPIQGKNGNKRSMYIVSQFSELLQQYFNKEHSVQFYADKLCISSQYLTKTTRKILGFSASRLIEDRIMTEAMIMLRSPKVSMKQIASELGFSDQSAFGKFFKKNNGSSPSHYYK